MDAPFRFTLLSVSLSALVGCSNQLPTYPIKGRVQFENGGPVVTGIVEFQSVEHKLNARGNIQPDGAFELTTFEPADGAVAGRHKCVVMQMVVAENFAAHRPSVIGVVDPRYGSYLTSGLEVEVSSESSNEPTLTVRGVRKQPEPGTDHEH